MSATTTAEECSATFFGGTLSSPAVVVAALVVLVVYLLNDKHAIFYHAKLWIEYLTSSVPTMVIEMTEAEASDEGVTTEPVPKMELVDPSNPAKLNCYDPSTRQLLGQAPNMTAAEVHELLVKAKVAQHAWSQTTFAQRRMVLRTIQKYVCAHVEDICRVSSRESGKPKVDAVVGEIITTCEKIRTICEMGELWLKPSYRTTGPMMVHKSAWVEYVPLGVIAAIAPWNYPFHNSVSSHDLFVLCGCEEEFYDGKESCCAIKKSHWCWP
jgi:Aldehyde dehydrogenase family